ncbi:MAG: EthD family reductase [Bacteroidota bacterium]
MKYSFILLTAILLCASFQGLVQISKIEKGRIKVTIMYPNEEGKTFDMEYYSKKHMPMVAQLFGDYLKGMSIDKGIAGSTPEESIPFLVIGTFYFNKLEDYGAAFGPNTEKILEDIPNYTNVLPIVQISEVVFR